MSDINTVPLVALGALLVICGVVYGVVRAFTRDGGRPADRRASDRSEVWASPRQVEKLLVDDPGGDRLLLGQMNRHRVATPPGESALVLAPTGRGKTAYFVVPAVLRWSGPVVVTSTQVDVVELTRKHRSRDGEPVFIFDPLGATDLPSCRWSPLSGAEDYAQALRAAQWIVDAARGRGAAGAQDEFWNGLGQDMLAPVLFAAAQREASMGQVVDWLLGGERAENAIAEIIRGVVDGTAPTGREPEEVVASVEASGGGANDDEDLKAAAAARLTSAERARLALGHWQATTAMDPRTKSSVSATARNVIRAFGHPEVAEALSPKTAEDEFTPAKLLDSGGTLYVLGAEGAQEQFGPVFESIVNSVIREVETRYGRHRRAVDPRLLLMLDEAGNIAPLQRLHKVASAYRQKGLTLCSVWQDLGQLRDIYGRDRAAVVESNHSNKVYLGGISDVDGTLEPLSRLIGDHQVERRSYSREGQGRVSKSVSYERVRVADPGYLRELPDGTSVVLAGNLPPIRLSSTPYFADPEMREKIGQDTLDRFAAMYGTSDGGARSKRRARRG